MSFTSSISHEAVSYRVLGFAGHAPNSLLVSNAPALKSLIGFIAELHPRAKRACGRSLIAKEMW